ncbi:hypothetical protein EJ02DRAFT_460451, partial [Clathrospora elynae]
TTADNGTNINYESSLGMSCQITNLTLCAIPNNETEHKNNKTYKKDETEYENDKTKNKNDETKYKNNDDPRVACSDDLISKGNMRSHKQPCLP